VDRDCAARGARALGLASLALGSVLAAPAARGADDPQRFEISGTQRTRYETLDSQFRAGLGADDQALALQTSVAMSFRPTARVQFLAEIMDSRAERNDERSFVSGAIVDALEPIQLNVAVEMPDAFEPGAESTLRIGRMTLDIGKRRAVSRNRYRNTVNNFTGIDWHWQDPAGRDARAFYLVPMRALPSDVDALLGNEIELDHALRGSRLIGLYYQLPAFADKSVLELYALDYEVTPPADQLATAVDLLTPGARLYRPAAAKRWSYEIEAMLQRGTSGGIVAGVARPDLRHRAHFAHLEIGYQFARAWAPQLLLQYDVATGDRNPNDERIERFNALFGSRRSDFGPTSIYGPFARSNIESPGVRLMLKPRPRWQTMVAYRSVSLEAPRDQWVGAGWRDATGASGASLGRQLEASFTWAAIKDRLSVETGFAQLRLGSFAQHTAGPAIGGDPTYFYAAVTTTF
jgi:hypothetical protein